jgi:hypothetical protein
VSPELATALLAGIATIIAALAIGFVRLIREMRPNSGSTMRDRIDRIEKRVDEIYLLIAKG